MRLININRKNKKIVERDISEALETNVRINNFEEFQNYCNNTIRNYLIEVAFLDKWETFIKRLGEVTTPWDVYKTPITMLLRKHMVDEVNIEFLKKLFDYLESNHIITITSHEEKRFNKKTQKNAYKLLLIDNLLEVIQKGNNFTINSIYSNSVINKIIWSIIIEELIDKKFISKSLFIDKYRYFSYNQKNLSYLNARKCIENSGIDLSDGEIESINSDFVSLIKQDKIKEEIIDANSNISFNFLNSNSNSFFTEEDIKEIISL